MKDNIISTVTTVFNDPRVVDTIDSLCHQSLSPDEVFVANAGLSSGTLDSLHSISDMFPFVRVVDVPGNVSMSRNLTLPLIDAKGSDDIIVIVDSDEVAPENYIRDLTKPIRDGWADFTGGYYKPLHPARNSVERYLHKKCDHLTHKVLFSPRHIPMGCSAWRRRVFDDVGGFDTSFSSGGEDFDVNLRALNNGFRGMVLPDVFLFHDLRFDSWFQFMKKRYGYHKGSLMAYNKNNFSPVMFHPYTVIDYFLKFLAYVTTRGDGGR